MFWLRPKNSIGGPRLSNTAMRCKFPVLQHLHFGEYGFLALFSALCIPNFCCKTLSFFLFQVLLKNP